MSFISTMKLFFRSRKPIRISNSNNDSDVTFSGRILDKRDVEDPTVKFSKIQIIPRTLNNSRLRQDVTFELPEYDLETIANAIQIDGLLNRAVNVYVEQIMKNGFEIVSVNKKLQEHVNNRIKEIEFATGIKLYETIMQAAKQLVSYGSAYIIKVRSNRNTRFGKSYNLYNKELNPIIGLFIAEATTMEIGLNRSGHIVQYKQIVNGKEKIYNEEDVIHLTYNKIPGTLTGMSNILPILDDLRALRKLEQEIEILGFQYAIPLYLYKVGNKDMPAFNGELEQVRSEIANMPSYGMLVVPGNHTIEIPDNTGSTPINILEFVNYFKSRIFSGLGVSPVVMGDTSTSNRNTAEVSDTSMKNITMTYQQNIKNRIELGLLLELVLDGRFDYFKESSEFNFPEIDLEQQIKFETNVIAKFQNNLIDMEEARNEMDYDTEINMSRTFLNLVKIPEIKAKDSMSATSDPKKKAISNKVAPANQHGKSSGRPKYVKNQIEYIKDELVINFNKFVDMRDFNNKFKLDDDFYKVYRENLNSYILSFIDTSKYDKTIITDFISESEKVFKSITDSYFNSYDCIDKRHIIIDSITNLLDRQNSKCENVAKLAISKAYGFRTILINADECNEHLSNNININNLSYINIPSYSDTCRCKIDSEIIDGLR